MDEIVNRVAESQLEVFDLEDFYPEGKRLEIDLAQWLDDGFLLREKQFRQELRSYDWQPFQDSYVALFCSTDAVVPAWAPILIGTYLAPFAKCVFSGRKNSIDDALYQQLLPKVNYEPFRDKPVIIKGCSKKPVPESAYLLAVKYLQPVARSIMYGEACSAVPLYKRK